MSIPVTINGTIYQIPEQGQSPPWGDDLTPLLQAIVEVINSTSGSSDILITSFNLANNVSSAANVNGLVFDTSQVRSAIVSYSISRSTSLSEFSEAGQIYVTYSNTLGSWEISQDFAGTSGISFSITNGGQIQYTSTNMSGTSYVGKLKFKAQAFLQT